MFMLVRFSVSLALPRASGLGNLTMFMYVCFRNLYEMREEIVVVLSICKNIAIMQLIMKMGRASRTDIH